MEQETLVKNTWHEFYSLQLKIDDVQLEANTYGFRCMTIECSFEHIVIGNISENVSHIFNHIKSKNKKKVEKNEDKS